MMGIIPNNTGGGLSPLARGTPGVAPSMTNMPRFIPARAGNTASLQATWINGAVYPRSRGEHINVHEVRTHYRGLSPLARGTRSDVDRVDLLNRFIPARAGNTWI